MFFYNLEILRFSLLYVNYFFFSFVFQLYFFFPLIYNYQLHAWYSFILRNSQRALVVVLGDILYTIMKYVLISVKLFINLTELDWEQSRDWRNFFFCSTMHTSKRISQESDCVVQCKKKKKEGEGGSQKGVQNCWYTDLVPYGGNVYILWDGDSKLVFFFFLERENTFKNYIYLIYIWRFRAARP